MGIVYAKELQEDPGISVEREEYVCVMRFRQKRDNTAKTILGIAADYTEREIT